MKDTCILCDFDGTVTEKDGLYSFFVKHANEGWREIEKAWNENKISSKECLFKEFEAVPDLSPELIENHVKTVKLDPYFKDFLKFLSADKFDFYIVSDGADYFINKALENSGIKGINIISNHFEFKNGSGFILDFPNDSKDCTNNAGTCKCSVLKKMKQKYKQVIYIGDGISDFCVSGRADILFAKKKLLNYCRGNNIKYIEFNTFKDIINFLQAKF